MNIDQAGVAALVATGLHARPEWSEAAGHCPGEQNRRLLVRSHRAATPQLDDRAVVLNWSDRRRWPPTLPVFLFRMFGGSREFNPMAIVFEPWVWPRRFRFYRAFRSFKHGRAEDVDKLRLEFFEVLDELAAPKAT